MAVVEVDMEAEEAVARVASLPAVPLPQ